MYKFLSVTLLVLVAINLARSFIRDISDPDHDYDIFDPDDDDDDDIFWPFLMDSETYTDDQFVRRIVAVGDLHGDYSNALKVLQMSNVVDAHGNWTGDVDVFVQTGDIIDG